ncbi:Hypothetical predicted protein, partial [Olea europaea subsp. europaea]
MLQFSFSFSICRSGLCPSLHSLSSTLKLLRRKCVNIGMGRGDIREVAVPIYTFFGGGVLGFSIKWRLGFGSGLVGGA